MSERGPSPQPTVAVAAIAIDPDGRVLLVRRGRPPGVGLWTVPGGRVELGESLHAACVREVAEETGLAVEVVGLVEVIERMIPAAAASPAAGLYHYVILDYLVRVTGGSLRAADDASDVRWCDAAALATLPLTDGLLPVLARARQLAP